MANKTVQRLSVSVKTNIELTDEEIAKRKHQLREYAKVLFSASEADVSLTYEEVDEDTAVTLWELFNYGRYINKSYMTVRLLNILRVFASDDEMKIIKLKNVSVSDILNVRNSGKKSAS